MHDVPGRLPAMLESILEETRALGFQGASEHRTGALLRVLAASRPGGSLVELGTGTGAGTCWLLDGMDPSARLTSVDRDATAQGVARKHLGADPRLSLVLGDVAAFLRGQPPGSADLVFADAWPGKFEAMETALGLLRPGGLYVADDFLPQPNWPEGDHAGRVAGWLAALPDGGRYRGVAMNWASGLAVVARLA
jgi:predicted O-methyltransferase YrrM